MVTKPIHIKRGYFMGEWYWALYHKGAFYSRSKNLCTLYITAYCIWKEELKLDFDW